MAALKLKSYLHLSNLAPFETAPCEEMGEGTVIRIWQELSNEGAKLIGVQILEDRLGGLFKRAYEKGFYLNERGAIWDAPEDFYKHV